MLIYLSLVLFVSCSAYSVDNSPRTEEQNWTSAKKLGGAVYLAIEKAKTTSPLEMETLEEKVPAHVLFEMAKVFIDIPFTLEQWQSLEANNITEQIIAFKDTKPKRYEHGDGSYTTRPRGCFKHQRYTPCICTDKHIPEDENDNSLPQNINLRKPYSIWSGNGQHATTYRADIIPNATFGELINYSSMIDSKENPIALIKHRKYGQEIVGKPITILNDALTAKENVGITITSNIDKKTLKNKVIHIDITGYNNSELDETLYFEPQSKILHFVATPTRSAHSIIPYLLQKVGTKTQIANLENLQANNIAPFRIPRLQIQSYNDVQKEIEKKNKKFCSIQ